jgi:hypothetical protein
VARLATLGKPAQQKLLRELVKAVDDELPDAWRTLGAYAPSKTSGCNQSINKSVHSDPDGVRHDQRGEEAQERDRMKAGTLLLSDTMQMRRTREVCLLQKMYNMSSMMLLYCSFPLG